MLKKTHLKEAIDFIILWILIFEEIQDNQLLLLVFISLWLNLILLHQKLCYSVYIKSSTKHFEWKDLLNEKLKASYIISFFSLSVFSSEMILPQLDRKSVV